MKFKCLVAVTLFLIIITVLAKEYVKSLPVGRVDSQGTKLFRLCETEPPESYLELKDPLDNWSAQAIQDLSQCVYVKEQYWNQCQITNSTATVFKYGEKFYTFTPHGMWTSRHVEIHVDPSNEINCGDAISVCKIEYSPDWLCYELHDPLDPWTGAAIEDPINMVYVDDIYLDQCALLKPNVTIILEQRPAYRYHSEYYTLDEFAFYDDFSFKFKRLINPLITISWILLGLVWLGSGVRNFWNSLKKKEAKTENRKGEKMRGLWWVLPFISCSVGLLIPYSFIHLTKVAYIAPPLMGVVGGVVSFYRMRSRDHDDAEFVFWVSIWFALAMLILSVNLFR